jgi:hypothetical protein
MEVLEFMKKIEPHLYDLDSYELQNLAKVDKYTLLPRFWQAMTSQQKRRAMTIVEEHGGNAWGVECCVKRSQELKVPMKDLLCFGGSITSRAWIGQGSGFCGVGC